jgi:hypothetical protein
MREIILSADAVRTISDRAAEFEEIAAGYSNPVKEALRNTATGARKLSMFDLIP